MMKKWTQSDLRFCKNEGSKRSKNNEKWGQLDILEVPHHIEWGRGVSLWVIM